HNVLPLPRTGVALLVHAQITVLDYVIASSAVAGRGGRMNSVQHCPHPLDQYAQREWLADKIVGADPQANHLVGLVQPTSQQDDCPLRLPPHPPHPPHPPPPPPPH